MAPGTLLRTMIVALVLVIAAAPGLADRETAEFFAARGEKALTAGDATDAEQQFRRALEEDAGFAPARYGLARALIAEELREDGVAELKRAVTALGAETSWKSSLQKARRLLDGLDKSGAELRALVDAHVEQLVAFARKWMKKDQDTAVRALRAALALSPGHRKASQMIEALGLSAKGPPRALFDGDSLTGWVEMGPPRWTVKDGAIVGDVEDGAYIGRTEDMFDGDFDILMEARLAQTYEGPSYFALAPAFDGKDGYYALGVLKGKLLFQEDVDADTDREIYYTNPPHEFEPTQWHVYELRLRGDQVLAFLDGEQIAADAQRPEARRSGFVGLKCQDCRVEIRRVEIVLR